MATSDRDDDTIRRNKVALIVLAVMAVAMGTILFFAFRSPPQMGTSEAVFHTVDALYTAVRNEDEKRLDECQQRLRGYREAGKLPADAAKTLDAIITTAKSGRWRSAAESLYDFMKGQRREGDIVRDHHPEPTGKNPKSKK